MSAKIVFLNKSDDLNIFIILFILLQAPLFTAFYLNLQLLI